MFIFFEMNLQQPAAAQSNSPQPPNSQQQLTNNVPTITPTGPSPVIKVPKMPGMAPPPMIRAVPQQPPPQQPASSTPSKFGDIAKGVALVGGGMAAGALANHFFGKDHNDDQPNEQQPTQKVSTKPSVESKPAPPPPPPPQPVINNHYYSYGSNEPPGSPMVQSYSSYVKSPTSTHLIYQTPGMMPGIRNAANYSGWRPLPPLLGPHPRVLVSR